MPNVGSVQPDSQVGLAEQHPVLEANGLFKRYGHVEALRGADFTVNAGEVVALIGDNGAGKSTLVRHLAGLERPDDGEIRVEGKPVVLSSAIVAQELGVEVVYQDLALAGDLDTPANLFLGREILRSGLLGKLGFLDNKAMKTEAIATLSRFGVSLRGVDSPIFARSGGERQSIAVARAVAFASKVIFMDEPTAALGANQRRRVLDLIKAVRDAGTAVVLISHNMPEVLEVADRIEVLRQGRRVARFERADATTNILVAAMTGEQDV